MMIIADISNYIKTCINDSWKDYKHLITKSLLNIDSDELMSIFTYITIQSQVPELMIHTIIIKGFTTRSAKNTMIGYYYITLEASLLYIMSIENRDVLKETKGVLKNSFLPNQKIFNDKFENGY